MQKPEWVQIAWQDESSLSWSPDVWWCKGCGCIKIAETGKKTKYKVPRRERERRKAKKDANRKGKGKQDI